MNSNAHVCRSGVVDGEGGGGGGVGNRLLLTVILHVPGTEMVSFATSAEEKSCSEVGSYQVGKNTGKVMQRRWGNERALASFPGHVASACTCSSPPSALSVRLSRRAQAGWQHGSSPEVPTSHPPPPQH